MSKEKYKRVFSLAEDFMNNDIYDLLYGAMAYYATYQPDEKKLYLTEQTFKEHRAEFRLFSDCKCDKTLTNRVKKLMDKGLVKKEKVCINGEGIPSYVLRDQMKQYFQYVDIEMLGYLIQTRNKNCLQVYIYLLDKYQYKRDSDEDYYNFTNGELKRSMGIAETTNRPTANCSDFITNILESFKREGIIDYEEKTVFYVDKYGKSKTKPTKILKFVAEKKSDLKPV